MRSIPSYSGVLIATLAVAFVAPSAQASCGDYVDYRGKEKAKGHTFAGEKPAPLTPCHGPHCSRRSESPTPVPAPVVSVVISQWACLDGDVEFRAFDPILSLPPEKSRHSCRREDFIYHPPRIAG
jgi:hypothetical protein